MDGQVTININFFCLYYSYLGKTFRRQKQTLKTEEFVYSI